MCVDKFEIAKQVLAANLDSIGIERDKITLRFVTDTGLAAKAVVLEGPWFVSPFAGRNGKWQVEVDKEEAE